jgi:putative ABC transport system ATP-binding protein
MKCYAKDLVVRNADDEVIVSVDELAVDTGGTTSISGPSGSGKTTLLYCLSGLIKPDDGVVNWDEHNVTTMAGNKLNKFRRENIGFIFQSPFLFDELDPLSNVTIHSAFNTNLSKEAVNEKAKELLDLFKVPLKGRKTASVLSGGEKQRLSMARGLVNNPKIILADEPTASLDRKNSKILMDCLLSYHKDYAPTLVVVSHDSSVLSRFTNNLSLNQRREADA